MTAEGQDKIYQMVTDRIVHALESGTVPWRASWQANGAALPLSMSTGKPYRSSNRMLLWLSAMEAGYRSPWWGTYDHIRALGGQVRKGERSTFVIFWKRYEDDKHPDPVTGKPAQRFVLRYYRVFNAEQADGLPERFYPAPAEPKTAFQVIESAEAIMQAYVARSGLTLAERGGQPKYVPALDVVEVPERPEFQTPEDFYDTTFHELVHSTGHKSRLNRDEGQPAHFGTGAYGREELVAEIGASMLDAVAGIATDATNQQNDAYVAGWLTKIKGEPRLVVQAAANAQRAADLILGTTFDQAEPEPVKAGQDLAA